VGRVGTNGGVAPPTTLGRCAANHAAQPLHSRGALVLGLRLGGEAPGATLYFDVQNYL
jgi:hypothetical protein